ncbi:MAG: bifunctional nuclease family protein [Chloroflexi bacterium]|nr:bifunctional nuclease family protein [Chloroflexota bacterium]
MKLFRFPRRALRFAIRTLILHRWSTLAIIILLAALVFTNVWRLNAPAYVADTGLEPRAADISGARELSVVGLGQDREAGRNIMVLKDRSSDRYLAVWIRQAEAFSIATQLETTLTPRPMTHDLLKSAISVLGGKVIRIMVTDFSDDTYYARVVLETADSTQIELDARPSDAVALAMRAGAPIYATETLLNMKGIKYAEE